MLLSLINIGSYVAFNAIVSLVIAGFFGSYFIPISMMAYKRINGLSLELGPWSMGRHLGLFTNVSALVWIIVTWIFSFFPIAVPVTLQSMNWSSVLWGVMMISGIALYFFYQRHKFTEPIIIYGGFNKVSLP